MANKRKIILLATAAILIVAGCAKKKKSDDFQDFGGISYNAAPKTLINSLGLDIAVQAMDINYDGKMDGLYICRTGGIKKLTINNAGSGYTNSPTVTVGACTTPPTVRPVIANGRVERIIITSVGSGCTSNSFPITISGGSGAGASAIATGASNNTLTRVSMVSKGSGYNAPAVTISGGGGSGAQAGVTVVGGVITAVDLINSGDNKYNSAPTVTVSGDTGTGGDISVVPLNAATPVTIVSGGSGYNVTPPTVTLSGGGGTYTSATPVVAAGVVTGVTVVGATGYTSPPDVTFTGGSGTGAAAVANSDLEKSELDGNGKCTVTYDPTNANKNLRHIPQMLFTWPVTPTVGLDTNGDNNADYYLYTNSDGTAQVMTNSDGSGAAAKLIVKNPAVDETNDLLYTNLAYGQVIGFDVLNNSTISNNILGKIALDREDPGYAGAANPVPIISPIRNGEFYGMPLDVNILCSDKVACNAITYSLMNGGLPADPNWGNTNLDPTGVDTTGTKHSIRPGDSSTISFQSLSSGTYTLKYIVRDAAGRESGLQSITFTVGRKPTVSINPVANPYVSNTAGTTATVQWSAETLDNAKPFRFIVVANSSCIEYTRADYFRPLPHASIPNVIASSVMIGHNPLGANMPVPRNTTVNTSVPANILDYTVLSQGVSVITVCAITCENATCGTGGTCTTAGCNTAPEQALWQQLSVWGDRYTTITRDDSAPSITASPSSGIYARPLEVSLIGSVTTGAIPINGALAPNEVCYTWGADVAGNPTINTTPADPPYPCPTSNNVVRVTGNASTLFNVGFNQRAMVTDTATYNANNCQGLGSDPGYCGSYTPGIYRIKYWARDAAGNITTVQSQSYAVGVTPQITTNTPPAKHVWQYTAGWGVLPLPNPVSTTTWNWQTDFPGSYEIRVGDTAGDCTSGTVLVALTALTPNTPIPTAIAATSLPTMGLNTVKVCFYPSGGGTVAQASQVIWRVQPQNFVESNYITQANTGSNSVLRVTNGACADVRFAPGQYIQWNFDGTQRQILTCDGSPAGWDEITLATGSTLASAPANVANIVVNANYTKSHHNKNGLITLDTASDIFNPPSAIQTITFSCPASSLGPDSSAACIQPTGSGTALGGGRPLPDVYPQYTIDTNAVLNNKITTLVYDVVITLCDTSGLCPAAGPTFTNNTVAAKITLNIVKDKTFGNSIYLSPTGSDANDGLVRAFVTSSTGKGPKRSLQSAATAAGTNKAIYILTGSYCSNGPPCPADSVIGTATIPSGTSIFGGYDGNWYRPNVASNQASIRAGSYTNADSIGISLGAVNQPVWIEGLNLTAQRPDPIVNGNNAIGIRATSGTNTLTLYKNTILTEGQSPASGLSSPGGSYGVFISGVNRVDLITNTITSSIGWRGSNGPGGGADGGDASDGGTAKIGQGGAAGSAVSCNDSHGHAAGGAGDNGGQGGANRGGNGGAGGWQDDGSGGANGGQQGGYDGETAPNGGGGGGGGANRNSGCGNVVDGGNGGTPAAASNGSNGPAPSFAFGQIAVSTFLQSFSGGYGIDGGQGLGGGGGGGGAGQDSCLNDSGSGGGGGGGGGQRATGGEGGVGGGPSVPIYLNSVSIVNASGNILTRGIGGAGGTGKPGGTGGNATNGGGGGGRHDDGGNGGTGGNGRAGGNGGTGSGGNGGQSFGMVIYPNVTPTCSVANTYFGGGTAAGGGAGAVSGINRQCAIFSSTTPGALTDCPAACGSNGP